MLNADRERARIQMEMGKKNITEAEENGVMKVNTENSPEAQAQKQKPNANNDLFVSATAALKDARILLAGRARV